jgi:hypothetical protein
MKAAELEQMMKLVGRSDVAAQKQHARARNADPQGQPETRMLRMIAGANRGSRAPGLAACLDIARRGR